MNTVVVRRQWNSMEHATYRLEDLTGVRWDTVSGGVQAPASQPFLHGYVQCDAMLEGDLAHSCQHGSGPHNVKVCIVRKDNQPSVFKRLRESAGPKPVKLHKIGPRGGKTVHWVRPEKVPEYLQRGFVRPKKALGSSLAVRLGGA